MDSYEGSAGLTIVVLFLKLPICFFLSIILFLSIKKTTIMRVNVPKIMTS